MVLFPGPRLYDEEPVLNAPFASDTLSAPVRVPPPILVTVKLWRDVPPMLTEPKLRDEGLILICAGLVPVPDRLTDAPPPPERDIEPVWEPAEIGRKVTSNDSLLPAPIFE